MHSTYEFYRPILGRYVNNNNKKTQLLKKRISLHFLNNFFFFTFRFLDYVNESAEST
jgi:hypothetical protein